MQSDLDLRVVLSLIEEREKRLRRTSLPIDEHRSGPGPVRRWVGQRLVRLGQRLAGEPPMRPIRAR